MLSATASGSSTTLRPDRTSLLARLKAYHWRSHHRGRHAGGPRPALPRPYSIGAPAEEVFHQGRILDTLGALEAIANYVRACPGEEPAVAVGGFSRGSRRCERTASPIPGAAPPVNYRAFGPEIKRTMAALERRQRLGLSHRRPRSFHRLQRQHQHRHNEGDCGCHGRVRASTTETTLNWGVRTVLDDSREVYATPNYPKAFTEDGAYHQISVRSSRPGVQLRLRRGYYATAAEVESTTDRRAPRALGSPLDSSEIGIQASVEPAGDGAGALASALHAGPRGPQPGARFGQMDGSLRLAIRTRSR